MANRGFLISAEIKAGLSPSAATQLRSDINNALRGISGQSVNVNVKVSGNSLNNLNRSIRDTSTSTRGLTKELSTLSEQIAATSRRFGVFLVAAEALGRLKRGLEEAVNASVEYQRELIRIQQVGGDTASEIA